MSGAKTVAITRSRDDAKEFIDLAENNNIKPLPLPTIELVSKGQQIVDEFLNSIKSYNPDSVSYTHLTLPTKRIV